MNSVFEIIFEKVTSLLDQELSSKLFKPKDEFFESILDFYHQLRQLDDLFNTVHLQLESLLEDFMYAEVNAFYDGRHRISSDDIGLDLSRIKLVLTSMKSDLQDLAPKHGLLTAEAIAAIDGLDKSEEVLVNKNVPEDIVNLFNPISGKAKDTIDWPAIVESTRQKCSNARIVIGTFLKETYTLEHFKGN